MTLPILERTLRVAASHRLNLTSLSVLIALKLDPAITMSRLAKLQRMTCAGATNAVEKLEELGLAARYHCADDRRKVGAGLTAKGLRVVERVDEQLKRGVIDRVLAEPSNHKIIAEADLFLRKAAGMDAPTQPDLKS